jgi:hypothetical protein
MTLYKHTLSGTFPGDEWSFSIHTLSALAVADSQTAWASAVTALWTGHLDAYIATDVEATQSKTVSITQATGRQINRVEAAIALPGVAATATLPPQCSCVVSLNTVVATRAGRGRFYLPPFATGALTAGRLAAGTVTGVVTAVEAMFTSLVASGETPVLYGVTTFLALGITGGSVGDVVDTQRRRRNRLVEARTALTV